MAKGHGIWKGFNSGELTPLLDGQIAFEKYATGCKRLENFLPTVHGAAINRPGFRFIAETKNSSTKKCRLVPFDFSTTQAYIIEFGHLYCRFYMNQGVISAVDANTKLLLSMNGTDASTTFTDLSAAPKTVTAFGNAKLTTTLPKFGTACGNFDGVAGTYISTPDHADWDFSNGSFCVEFFIKTTAAPSGGDINYIMGVAGPAAGNVGWGLGENAAGRITAFQSADGSSDVVSLLSVSSINDGNYHHVAFVRSGNNFALYIDGVSEATAVSAHTQYNSTSVLGIGRLGAFTTAPYFNGYLDELRVSKGAARYTANFVPPTAEFIVGLTAYEIETTYTETELPELQFTQSNDVLYIVHPNHAPATLSRTGHAAWTLANISFTAAPAAWGAGTYPSCVTFFEQRLWFGYLQTLWASKSGDFSNMTVGTSAGDGLAYTIGSQQANKLQWLAAGKILVAGTAGGEYKISASSLDEAITPSNVRVAKQSSYGSDYKEALPIADIILYLQRSKRKIREFTYNSLEDSYASPDMTVLARHLFNNDINYMSYQQEPYSIVWCVKADGVLLAFTYHRLEGITAWSKHVTDGDFEAVASIYGQNGNNETWVVVNRTIGGVTKRYVEMLEYPFDDTTLDSDECFFVDSGLSYSGVSTTTLSGLSHLEGETVSVLANGVVFDNAVVASGSITLKLATVTTAATRACAGLPITSILQTMRPEAGDASGTAQGRKKRTNRAVFRFYKTKQYQFGTSPTGTLERITLSSLYSGDDARDFVPGWDREGYITIVNDKPLPITVVAIIPEMSVS